MSRIRIDWDERYLDFFVDRMVGEDDGDQIYDVPEETLARWQKVREEYRKMQDEMRKLTRWNDD